MNQRLLLAPLLAAACQLACNPGATSQAEAREKNRETPKLTADSHHLGYLKVEPVTETSDAPSVLLTGKLAYNENHTQRVASPIDGRATKLLVELGDKVKEGQPLIELSSPNVGQLQADVQKAAQDMALIEKALVRVHKLQEDGAVSEKDVAQVESDYRKAKADVASTTAKLHSLNLAVADPAQGVALRAHIAGTVVERNILVGQEVRADGVVPLLTLSDLGILWAVADVYEQDIPLIQEGAAVTLSVTAYPGVEFAGTVGHLGDVVDPVSRTVKLRCVVPNPDGRLKPEMFANIMLRDPGVKKIVVPSRAVLSETQPPRVVTVGTDGTFQLRKVDIGPEVAGRVRVLSGLKPGEKIVTDGAIFLKQEIENQ